MRAVLAAASEALLASAAAACPVPAWGPVPVLLATDGSAPSALLVVPAGWEAGDPAVLLRAPDAFRLGCAAPGVAGLLEEGVMVLALDPGRPPGLAAAQWIAAAVAVTTGYGARPVAAMSPAEAAPGPGPTEMALAAPWPPD